MDPFIERIQTDLKARSDPGLQRSSQRFFKEEIRCYGIKTATVVALAKQYWKEIKNRDKLEIFSLCENLYQSGYLEETFIVSQWAHALSGRYEPTDILVFRHWIDSYITNWASCDGFCNHTMGDFIDQFPEYISELNTWAASKNRWMRRAAAVSLIVPVKHGKFLPEALKIADLLLTDGDDMVRKGYGWLLKEASRQHQAEVFEYVMQNKQVMPRTALRYAIELMPKDMRAEAMKKQ